MSKGILIAFTGIDGSGKTTQVKLLEKALRQDGKHPLYVWSRWKPFLLKYLITIWKNVITGKKNNNQNVEYDTMEESKQTLLGNAVFRYLWLIAFFIDYSLQLLIKVRIGLLRGQLILSDRTFYDSLIDQSINLGNRQGLLLNNLDAFWIKILFPKPDLVIYIDCSEDLAFLRKNDAPNVKYLRERRELYLKLALKNKWIKIDGTTPIETIALQIKAATYKFLGL